MSIGCNITYRNIVLAICLIFFMVAIVPMVSGTERFAIIAVRTTSVDNLGHVGVGFQNVDGTWTIGAIENPGSSPIVIPGADNRIGIVGGIGGAIYNNGGWVESHKSLQEVATYFHSLNYDGIKIIPVSDPNPSLSNRIIDGFPTRGYDIVRNNCLSATVEVLSAYNVKNLPLEAAHKAPNDYYANVQGEEYLWDSSKKKYTNIATGISLTATDSQKSSILGLGTPLLPSPTSDTSPSNSNKGPYVPPTTTVTKVSYSPNMPGNWIMYIGSTPTRLTFTQEDVRNEVLNEFPDADLSRIDSMGKIYDDKGQTNLYSWWTLSETAPGVYEVYGMIGSPFSGTINENGLLGWVGHNMRPMHAEKIGDSPMKKIVTTYNVPSNVAGVGPLGGGGGSW